jgi:hypothetical protein
MYVSCDVRTSSIYKNKAIPVTGRGGSHTVLDSRLTDGSEARAICANHRFTPQKHYFYASDTHFC